VPARARVKRLSNAPLILSLCQVRFATILDLSEHIPALQREFKALGYLRFEETQLPAIRIVPQGAPQIQLLKRWQFLTSDRDAAIVLTTDFVSVITSTYHTFERLLAHIITAVGHLKTTAGIELVDRVGLRYVDLIRPRDDEAISDYVHESLLGLPLTALRDIGAARTSVSSETQFSTQVGGTLVVRLRQLEAGAVVPPDLDASLLKPRVSLQQGESAFALDCDHYCADLNKSVDLADLEGMLWSLHSGVHAAFSAAVTPHALEVWGPVEEVSP
jgi:uncharacterized protein (TIGR04255 family)